MPKSVHPRHQLDIAEAAELQMGDHFHVRHAHKYVAVYLFALLFLLAAGGVYAWQHGKTQELAAQMQTLQKQVQALQAQLAGGGMPQTMPVSTKGWQTYCSDQLAACFQYPANWKISAGAASSRGTAPGAVSITAMSADQKLQVILQTATLTDLPVAAFHTSVVTDPASRGPGLKIAGGYFIGSTRNQPVFVVLDAAAARSLKAGSTAQLNDPPSFVGKNNQMLLSSGGPAANDLESPTQAEAWFGTPDARTVLTIMRSIYYK